jgi:hypothetical protein
MIYAKIKNSFEKTVKNEETKITSTYFNQNIDSFIYDDDIDDMANKFLNDGFNAARGYRCIQVFKEKDDSVNSLQDFEKQVLITFNK